MKVSTSRLKSITNTIVAICESTAVDEFIIGLTKNINSRRRAYEQAIALKYPHFIVLETALNCSAALDLEKVFSQVFETIQSLIANIIKREEIRLIERASVALNHRPIT